MLGSITFDQLVTIASALFSIAKILVPLFL